jgi:hypothetical protein
LVPHLDRAIEPGNPVVVATLIQYPSPCVLYHVHHLVLGELALPSAPELPKEGLILPRRLSNAEERSARPVSRSHWLPSGGDPEVAAHLAEDL